MEKGGKSSRLLQLFRDEGLHISGYYRLCIASEKALMNAVHVHSTAYHPAVPLRRSEGFQRFLPPSERRTEKCIICGIKKEKEKSEVS